MNIQKEVGVVLLFTVLFLFCCAACGDAGSVTAADKLPKSDEYDEVLCSGGGYHIVWKRVEELSGVYDMVGVINDQGEWVQPLSQDHPFIDGGKIETGCNVFVVNLGDDDSNATGSYISSIKRCLKYDEEGIFSLHYKTYGFNSVGEYCYHIYNAETGKGFDVSVTAGGCGRLVFHDGYSISQLDEKIQIVSCDGEIRTPDIRAGRCGIYAESVFFAGNCFYDIDGNMVIDLSAYSPDQFRGSPYFEDNVCRLELVNENGTIYETEIDHDGKFLYEPRKK